MLSEVLVRHVLLENFLLEASEVVRILLHGVIDIGVDHVAREIVRVIA